MVRWTPLLRTIYTQGSSRDGRGWMSVGGAAGVEPEVIPLHSSSGLKTHAEVGPYRGSHGARTRSVRHKKPTRSEKLVHHQQQKPAAQQCVTVTGTNFVCCWITPSYKLAKSNFGTKLCVTFQRGTETSVTVGRRRARSTTKLALSHFGRWSDNSAAQKRTEQNRNGKPTECWWKIARFWGLQCNALGRTTMAARSWQKLIYTQFIGSAGCDLGTTMMPWALETDNQGQVHDLR